MKEVKEEVDIKKLLLDFCDFYLTDYTYKGISIYLCQNLSRFLGDKYYKYETECRIYMRNHLNKFPHLSSIEDRNIIWFGNLDERINFIKHLKNSLENETYYSR